MPPSSSMFFFFFPFFGFLLLHLFEKKKKIENARCSGISGDATELVIGYYGEQGLSQEVVSVV
jgi:hypothetical protein